MKLRHWLWLGVEVALAAFTGSMATVWYYRDHPTIITVVDTINAPLTLKSEAFDLNCVLIPKPER